MAKKKKKYNTTRLTRFAPLFPNHISIRDDVMLEYEIEKDKYSKQFGKMSYVSDSDFIANLLLNNNAEDVEGILASVRDRELRAKANIKRNKKKQEKVNEVIRRFQILVVLSFFKKYKDQFNEYLEELNEITDDYGYDYAEEKEWQERLAVSDRDTIYELIFMEAEAQRIFEIFPNLLDQNEKTLQTPFRVDFKNDIAKLKDMGMLEEDEELFLTDKGISDLEVMFQSEINGVERERIFPKSYKGWSQLHFNTYYDTPPSEYFSKIVKTTDGAFFPDKFDEYDIELEKIKYKYRREPKGLRERKIEADMYKLQDKLREQNPDKYGGPEAFYRP
tara:strand:+ start:206 stop:1204 length:999 start_codon:yes stop_codon:yes gene_type:complete